MIIAWFVANVGSIGCQFILVSFHSAFQQVTLVDALCDALDKDQSVNVSCSSVQANSVHHTFFQRCLPALGTIPQFKVGATTRRWLQRSN